MEFRTKLTQSEELAQTSSSAQVPAIGSSNAQPGLQEQQNSSMTDHGSLPRQPDLAPVDPPFDFNAPLLPISGQYSHIFTPLSDTMRHPHEFNPYPNHNLSNLSFTPHPRPSMVNPHFSPSQVSHHDVYQQQHLPYNALPQQQPLPLTLNPNPVFAPFDHNSLTSSNATRVNLHPSGNPSARYTPPYQGEQPHTEQNMDLYSQDSLGARRRNHSLTQRQALRYGDLSI